MRAQRSILFSLFIAVIVLLSSDAFAGRRVKTAGEDAKKSKKKGDLKKFSKLIKDKVKIEGLFTFYQDTTDNSWLMEIKPEQFGPIYLCGETRSQSEGAYFDNGAMRRSWPFYFERIGKKIMMLEKNLRFRADSSSTLYRAVESGISNHLWGSTEVKSVPNDSGAILIDPTSFFVRDATNASYFLGKAKTGISFDKSNSYFKGVKSFPENTEIDVRLHFKTSKPLIANTMQNQYSLFHTYHYSLSTIPETGYVPRLADDRLGHFLTLYQDYTNLETESPYVRYVERWHLKKKDPGAELSEPVEPIVFWIENTVPVEYRDAVATGIEFWNLSFEKIGFKNAVVAKQMPDDAEWDPADVRYNTVRWVVVPSSGYVASGPSRSNPFTGQKYDADIRVSSDVIRYLFNNMEYFIKPVSFDGFEQQMENPIDLMPHDPNFCNYGNESAKEAAFGLAYIQANTDDLAEKDALTKEYVNAYVTELIAHEVGHTLGFRHNFKASTIYNMDQITDRDFTTKYSTGGTVMDYTPPNIAGRGKEQGEFYASVPGPYDDWVVEYAYSDFGDLSTDDELPKLQEIAGRASEIGLAYGTDEDAYGYSNKSVDPFCNLFDLGDDPLAYAEHKLGLTAELWHNSLKDFEREGKGFQKVLRAFNAGWRSYRESVMVASKFIGGLHHNRFHVGDAEGVTPFTPVAAVDQRRAMKLLADNIFAADAFDLPAGLWNRLQPDRFQDFDWKNEKMAQLDYPIHARVLAIQQNAINRLYSPYILGRLINNLQRYEDNEEPYTMYEMFATLRGSIWSEIDRPRNVNSFRRQLQLTHLRYLVAIYLSRTAVFPYDARTLAGNDLDRLESKTKTAVKSGAINNMTKIHFKEVLRQISAAKGAKRTYSKF